MGQLRNAFHIVFYHTVVTILRGLLTFGGQVTRLNFSPLPKGAFVMVSNHISHFDPPFLSGWLPYKIDWIAMAELFGSRWSQAMFTWLDVIPVDRDGDDRNALRHALKRLAEGHVIGVFPEGGIRNGERSMLAGGAVRDGAITLAVHAQCPIVPVVILGSERLYNAKNWLPWRRAHVYIAWGAPIFPPREKSRAAARKQMRGAVSQAMISLKDKLIIRCSLGTNDLPHSPQQRMAEA